MRENNLKIMEQSLLNTLSNCLKSTRLMTHLVAGYPNFSSNLKLLQLMGKKGVDLVEIQIPFSEPIADGNTITRANHQALKNGVTLKQVFAFLARARKMVKIPFLIMTYYNIPFQMGLAPFLKKCKQVGISGLIIPDIPFDEVREDYFKMLKKFSLTPVLVISPTTKEIRLNQIKQFVQNYHGFIYITLKAGITGSKKKLNQEGIKYLQKIRKQITSSKSNKASLSSPIFLAAGFGLSSSQQIKTIAKHCDIVVIGSYIIELFQQKGLTGVENFLSSL